MSSVESNRAYLDKALPITRMLFSAKLYEDCLAYAQNLASFSWMNFTGYYTNWGLERILKEVSQKVLQKNEIESSVNVDKRQVLHVVTKVYKVGGHSKLLFNWIKKEKQSEHSVLATSLTEDELKEVCSYYLDNDLCNYIGLGKVGYISRAQKLLDIAQNYDLVLLHIHPNDIIPVVAFANSNMKVPVAFLNHADHTFWVGASITDILIQIREPNMTLDRERRQIENQFFIPIPIDDIQITNKENIRLAKSADMFVLLSTGSDYKFTPTGNYNFFKAIYDVVSRHQNVIVYLAGVDENNIYYNEFKHNRVQCLGTVDNLWEYELIADLYVEGFPMPSFTALLQPALRGVPFLLHYQPFQNFQLFVSNPEKGITYPSSLEDWHKRMDVLIVNKEYREQLAKKQYDYVWSTYASDKWLERVHAFYDIAGQIKHKVSSSGTEKYYDGTYEQKLRVLDSLKVEYVKHTRKLNFKNKLDIILQKGVYNENVIFLTGIKEKVYYLFFKE